MTKSMTVKEMADKMVRQLKERGFHVLRYDAYSTQSVYLKLDYGVANSIRISDHTGKSHLRYRYNLVKGEAYGIGRVQRVRDSSFGWLERYYYSFAHSADLIKKVVADRDAKVRKYGIDRYQQYMEQNKAQNQGKTAGFWAQAVEV